MRQLFPTPAEQVDLPAIYGDLPEPPGRPGVRVNMVASLDGATAVDGRSGPLGGAGDRAVFRMLRSLADVILVAAGTVRAEGYGPAKLDEAHVAQRVARGQTPLPAIAVVSRSLDLDWDASLFTAASVPSLVVTIESAPAATRARAEEVAEVIVAGERDVDLAVALAAIGSRGARHVLCEGGPSLNGALAAAGLIDEVCLSIAPLVAGGRSARIVAGPPLSPPLGMALLSLCEEDDVLFARFARR